MQEVVTFRTVDPTGADVYHTNVMMAIGTDVAVVCAEAVPDERQRKHLLERLNRHHKVRGPLHIHSTMRALCSCFCNATVSPWTMLLKWHVRSSAGILRTDRSRWESG